MTFGHQVSQYIKEKHGSTLEVLMPIGGNPARIALHTRYESLAQCENLTAKLLADKTYMEIVSKHAETLLPGSVCDHIWRTI